MAYVEWLLRKIVTFRDHSVLESLTTTKNTPSDRHAQFDDLSQMKFVIPCPLPAVSALFANSVMVETYKNIVSRKLRQQRIEVFSSAIRP